MRLRTCSPSIPFSGWAKCLPTVVVNGRRVHYPTTHVPDSVDLETFVTFCGMVWLRATVLGRMGWKPSPIQERVLYPAHRLLFTGRGWDTLPGPRCATGPDSYRPRLASSCTG
jgi:hypothetical protein